MSNSPALQMPTGRVQPPPDPGDKLHPFTAGLPPRSVALKSKMWLRGPRGKFLRLNQGDTPVLPTGDHGSCVGHAGANWRQGEPLLTPIDALSGYRDYLACKDVDDYPGEGTFGRALMKVYQAQGILAEYLWAPDSEQLVQWLITRGGVLVGIPWYNAMFYPDALGYIKPGGRGEGGHEIYVRGYDHGRKAYRLTNSWGGWWGQDGECWIKRVALDGLIFSEGGDACGAIQKLAA